jgi:hypothetical protein
VLVAVGVGVAVFLALWLLPGGGPIDALRALLAAGGTVGVLVLLPVRPLAALGVVFLLAVFSAARIELPVGALRLEQPALVALLAAVVWHRRRLALPSPRPLLPLIAAAAIFLAVLTVSSAVVADQPAASLRMVAWFALSMAGGFAAALLVAGRAARTLPWLTGATGLVALIGMVIAVAYLLFAVGTPWVVGTHTFSPRISAFTHEPNIYASLLAASVPLAIEQIRLRPAMRHAMVAVLILAALGLGVTRAAYVGLVVGLAVYFVLTVWRGGHARRIARIAAMVALAGVIGLVLPTVLLNPNHAGVLRPIAGAPPPERPVERPDRPRNELGTWEYRMGNVRRGITDLADSPIIGRGAYSFGQRHLDPNGNPDVVAIWPLAVLHDSGVVGLAALLSFFGLYARRAWRAARDPTRGGPATAFGAAVAVLLVAYLATTALHFATTWLIIGAAVGATLAMPRRAADDAAESF